MPDKPLTVSQLNQYVSELFAGDSLLRALRVEGEISGFKRHTSGHLYFSLKDETALVRCVMFKQQAMRLRFFPKDGMRVVLSGYASLYARDGAYQLYALDLAQQGAGDLYRRYLELKDRLEAEGYFDSAHKKPIPFLPGRVGVVTSATGAAVQDVMNIISRRFPPMPMVLASVRVQGPGAAEEIARAIRAMNRKKAADVLIVGRGGGSMEDLWAFNEPEVAGAIYESEIPIISAVGHETDFTIADFTADLRAPTPSAAAELAVPEWNACVEAINGYARRLHRGLRGTVERAGSRVRLLQASRGFRAPMERLAADAERVERCREEMTRAVENRLGKAGTALAGERQRLETLSPAAVLGRGYALVQHREGRVAAGVGALSPGERVRLTMADGDADATVDSIHRKEDE